MYSIISFLILVSLLFYLMNLSCNSKNSLSLIQEGFDLGGAAGDYPKSETDVLVQDSYPITGINGVSKEQASTMWWHYPIFEVGSYKQITNNLKYPNNPDTGRCMPADTCFALYKDFQVESNYIEPLPPVNTTCTGARVGYFLTDTNMLPFRTEDANVLF
jgi:hypothetical protein